MGSAAVHRLRAVALVGLLIGLAGVPVSPAAADAPGDFADPFVLPLDDGYLAVATTPTGGGMRVQMRRSADLRQWSESVEALPRVATWARGSVWAPAIAAPAPGQWRLYYAVPHAVTRLRCISVATALAPEGPYVDRSVAPLTCDDARGGAIDPEVFDDDEGRQWLHWKTEGRPDDPIEAALWSQQLDADGTGLLGERRPLLERKLDWERPLIENPSMVSHGGKLLLFYSAGIWQNDTYKVGVARCHSPAGPCERLFDKPVLSTRPGLAGPGGASAFYDRSGRLRLAFHSWSPDRVGYGVGGVRSLHVGAVTGDHLAVGADPMGSLDDAQRVAPTVARLRGWAADIDGHAPIDVHVYADGVGVGIVRAGTLRPDVEAAHPGLGANRGWEALVEVGPGRPTVCAYGINVGLGVNTLLGCRSVS